MRPQTTFYSNKYQTHRPRLHKKLWQQSRLATVVEAAAEEAESTPPTLADIKAALEASNKRGNSLHLRLPTQADNTTLTGSVPFATLLPFTSLAPEGDLLVQVETLNLFEQL